MNITLLGLLVVLGMFLGMLLLLVLAGSLLAGFDLGAGIAQLVSRFGLRVDHDVGCLCYPRFRVPAPEPHPAPRLRSSAGGRPPEHEPMNQTGQLRHYPQKL
jgi:hypothetical protein